jgi:hypothetical protein
MQWRFLEGLDVPETNEAVRYAVTRGWVMVEGGHSVCLTDDGRRGIALAPRIAERMQRCRRWLRTRPKTRGLRAVVCTTMSSVKPVILVVEDEVLIRMMAVRVGEDSGFEALSAASADEAISILESRSDVRLVFTDVNMPGSMDGLRADSGSLDSGIRSYLGQASEHDTDHGEADEGNGGGGVSLEVASEPAIASDPGKGALDDPSLGQDDELVGFTPFDDFKLPSTGIGNDLCDPWPLIGGISEELGD